MRPLSWLLAGLLLACPAAAGDEDAPPAAPAAPADDAPRPDPAPSPAPAAPAEPVLARPPANLAEALERARTFLGLPLRLPGSLTRRNARLGALIEAAMALEGTARGPAPALRELADIAGEARRPDLALALLDLLLARDLPDAMLDDAAVARVIALVRLDRLEEGEQALEVLLERLEPSPALATALGVSGDALAARGEVERARERYAGARRLHGRPFGPAAAAAVQGEVECLVALGRLEDARTLAATGVEHAGDERGVRERLRAVRDRLQRIGQPWPVLQDLGWEGADAPDAAELEGRVVVWHLFTWWMDVRIDELDTWHAAAERFGDRGLVVLPVTRLTGWDPEAGQFRRATHPPEVERAAIRTAVRAHWPTRPFGIATDPGTFRRLGVRGLPTEVVVDRDGRIAFLRASGEAGPGLSLAVVERLLAEREAGDAPPAGDVPGTEPGPAPSKESGSAR